MRKARGIVLDADTRKELERLGRSRSESVRLTQRSRIVLLAATGLDNEKIGAELGITRQKAGRWRSRFAELGLEGILKEEQRSGRPPSISNRKRAAIVRKTLDEKPTSATQWSRALMSAEANVSPSTVGRIWRAHGLKPHLVSTFKLSNDTRFAEKLEDVVGLYLSPPENAIVLSCDEKSQIQALDRTQPGLPMKKGRCGTMTHDYKRNGTTTLFAALNVLEGTVITGAQFGFGMSGDRVREITDKRSSGADVKQIIAKLNPVLRGWGNYFRTGTCRRESHRMDDFVYRRLLRWLNRWGGQRPGRSILWKPDHFKGMGLFQLCGTVRYAAQAAPVRSSLSRVRE